MENFIKMGGGSDLVNPETDEIIPGEYVREMFGYTGIYRQHMSAGASGATSVARAETGVATETDVETVMTLKRFDEMTAEELQRCRKDYPYLFYDGESQIDVYWRKWRNAVKNPFDEFAWRMLNDAGKLIGLTPMNPALVAKIRNDLRAGQKMRNKYLYRIEKMAGKGSAMSGSRLYTWVHDANTKKMAD